MTLAFNTYAVSLNHCWGQLGRGNTAHHPDNYVPRPVSGTAGVRVMMVAAGAQHCAVLSDAGILLTWGRNDHGQCGTGAAGTMPVAAMVRTGALAPGSAGVSFVACGYQHIHSIQSFIIHSFIHSFFFFFSRGFLTRLKDPNGSVDSKRDLVRVLCRLSAGRLPQKGDL